ncbi:hypothetical protein Tco_0725869 [Tanacetum coccineum]|uniref:Uncharacterized protein n=1 Tax=Tanacetum coccineum TaxID=301880 RepID=A0ABQ4YE30_9ASTR
MQPGVIRLGKQNPQSSGDLHEQQRRSLGFSAEANIVNYGLVEVVACGVVEAAEVCIRKKKRTTSKAIAVFYG